MNILFCSVGRRGELLKNFRKSMSGGSKIVAVDNSVYAPALYFADKQYIVPPIKDEGYIDIILDICERENINAVTTLIDPEIMLLAKNREKFKGIGVLALVPNTETARLCFDKYEMSRFLGARGIRTIKTYGTYGETMNAVKNEDINFPVFVKPRSGSGSVGAKEIQNKAELKEAFDRDASLIVQELMRGEEIFDLDADIYVDTISHNPVSAFFKKKISTTIGGANKSISFKDKRLIDFIEELMKYFKFNGPLDADFFLKDGQYYLSEINPRFGGAYLHAYGAGVDFVKLIENNVLGIANKTAFENYEEDVVMMMYDSVVIKRGSELIKG